jgi:hypothetical protein
MTEKGEMRNVDAATMGAFGPLLTFGRVALVVDFKSVRNWPVYQFECISMSEDMAPPAIAPDREVSVPVALNGANPSRAILSGINELAKALGSWYCSSSVTASVRAVSAITASVV